MKRFSGIVLLTCAIFAFCISACSRSSNIRPEEKNLPEEEDSPAFAKFSNPVTSFDWPDPTIWRNGDRFYMVATGVSSILTSSDMVKWNKMNSAPLSYAALNQAKLSGSNFWAPDVVKVGSKWMLYLTCYNSASDCGIAAFSSDSASGPFEWEGIITHSKQTGIQDTIDPEVVYDEENSKLWLFFGSIGRVHRVLLSQDGCSVAPGAEYIPVAGLTYSQNKARDKVFEGSYLHRHDGYWYLFVSSGNYGDTSYRIKVGRSTSLEGEFIDKDGNRMLDGYASELLSSSEGDRFYGPGHNGEIFTDLRGQDYMFYHCHDRSKGTQARYTFLQRLFWDRDGWPYFETGKPLGEELAPSLLRFADPFILTDKHIKTPEI